MRRPKARKPSRGSRPYIPYVVVAALILFGAGWYALAQEEHDYQLSAAVAMSATSSPSTAPLVPYDGRVYHVFFHSLIVYPELAYKDDKRGDLYRKYMITEAQFKVILESLYQNQFVLIDIHALYTVNSDGTVVKKTVLIPKGKKPLIISLDDLSYYETMSGRGFAHKLVLDQQGNVATAVMTPQGQDTVTRDGDVVPILDDFVAKHPDFSVGGAKGVIAVTGFDGILGYRTEASSTDRAQEVAAVAPVVAKLKATGWQFASHSYSHKHAFVAGTITLAEVKEDTALWQREVEPLVGPTDLYIGPFGQIFKPGDPRQEYLISQGFKMLCGVGLDHYLRYTGDRVLMDRANIDGFRITHTPKGLAPYFDVGDL